MKLQRLTVACLLSMLVVPQVPAQQEAPVSEYRVVFGSQRDGDFASSIYSVTTSGDDLKRISRHSTGRPNCLDPKVSTDSTRIIFARDDSPHRTAVWSMNADGSDEIRLTEVINRRFDNHADASFSPDGERFIYGSNLKHNADLFLVTPGRDEPQNLTMGKGKNKSVEWHPTRDRIVFASDRSGDTFGVYTLDLDGDAPRLVTPSEMIANFPSWSPKGDRILFSGSTDGEQYELYTVKPDGSDLVQVTRTKSLSEREAAFSPDGRWIAFEATPSDAPRGFERSIYVLEASSGQVRKLTESKYHDTSASWMRQGARTSRD